MVSSLFQSFFIAGFECSTHRLRSGKRLDLITSTQHDKFVKQDFQRMKEMGIQTCRDGIRWHLIETRPYKYDFSSVQPFLKAAQEMNIQIIWDLCHYGYPGELDIFKPAFVQRFTRMVREFARYYAGETDMPLFFCPVNEISFFSWGGGDVGYLNPFAHGRGFELKVQLARAAIEAIEAVWETIPNARPVHVDPVINIVHDQSRPEDIQIADGHRIAQYQAWDLICGRMWPQIGGDPKYLDIIGLNYYHNNQWIHDGPPIYRDHPQYRPFRELIAEVAERYRRPVFIAETGIEDDARPDWMRYVLDEVMAAIANGTRVEGLCLYPVLCHPGWDNDRHCHNGLWDYANDQGEREIYQPLADVLMEYQPLLQIHPPMHTEASVPAQSANGKKRTTSLG